MTTRYDYAVAEAASLILIGIGMGQVWTPWATMLFGLAYFLLTQGMALRSRRRP